MKLSRVTATLFTLLLALVAGAGAQTGRSLPTVDSEPDLESDAQLALERLDADNDKLRKELASAQKLAAHSQAQAEEYRRQIGEIKLRMEALGVSTAGDPSKLEQRLLQAVRDLQLALKARKLLSDHVVKLADAASAFVRNQDDSNKKKLDAVIRETDELLTQVIAGEVLKQRTNDVLPPLLNGKVSAVTVLKTGATCVVINIGARQGVKVGMPFQVRRNDRSIAIIRAVDVRKEFAGAVVQNLSHEKDTIQLGDSVRVNAQK